MEKCRKHPEMFSEDKLTAIFGNITAIYGLSIKFLAELEAHIDTEKPYLSNIGKVFLDHVSVSLDTYIKIIWNRVLIFSLVNF